MSRPGLFEELKRRRVFRATAAYVVVAITVAEVANNFFPALELPPWTITLVVVLAILGLPVTIALSWAFDIETSHRAEGGATSERSESAGTDGAGAEGVAPARGSIARWTAGRIAVVGAVAVLALAGAAMLFTGGDQPFPVLENRVAVLPFENHTDDPELDQLGMVAADWITNGLTDIDTVQAVPASDVRQLLEQRQDAERLTWLAQQTGAGLAITGSYLLVGDSLQITAQLVDPLGPTTVASFGPVRSPRSDPMAALAPLGSHVLGAVATRFGTDAAFWELAPPPSYDAYQTFVTGIELFNADRYDEAIREFDAAWAADSTFWQPLFWTATAFANLAEPRQRDSVISLLRPHRRDLSEPERLWLDWQESMARGDQAGAYRAARQGYRRAPGSVGRYITALYALRVNRPREALATLREEPTASWYRTVWYWYHDSFTEALHVLGEHQEELKAATEARAIFPDHPGPVYLQARALAGLDRPEDAEALVDDLVLFAASPATAVSYMTEIGDALAAHGHQAAAERVYTRALTTWKERGAAGDVAAHLAGTELLRRLGRLEEAAAQVAAARALEPADGQAHAMEGIIAAQQGDRARAERIEAELAARDDPYDDGRNAYGRACIRALLGDVDRAVELLRQAHAEGQSIDYWIRTDPDLRSLHGHPGYEELIRPNG